MNLPKFSKNVRRLSRGSALVTTLVLTGVVSISLAAMMQWPQQNLTMATDRWHWNEAYFHGENALQWAAQQLAQGSTSGVARVSIADGTLPMDYLKNTPSASSNLTELAVRIEPISGERFGRYRVTTATTVGGKRRVLEAILRRDPPSRVLDYEFFLNNSAIWVGTGLTGYGDSRANGDFAFQGEPQLRGRVIAAGEIRKNDQVIQESSIQSVVTGEAASKAVPLFGSASRLDIPNLHDLDSARARARTSRGVLKQGSRVLVTEVRDNLSQPGFFLKGLTNAPLEIHGAVVIPGDVVLSGLITGRGTLYIGGNLYIAGDITYVNSPDYKTPPDTFSPERKRVWVENNAKKDLVCFAVGESILGGQVNGSEWRKRCYSYKGHGLKFIGKEDRLGADGLAGTSDDAMAFMHEDGTESTWSDTDEDQYIDGNYDFNREMKMTSDRAKRIAEYPVDSDGDPLGYEIVTNNKFNRIDGFYCTQHAVGIRSSKKNLVWHGGLAARDPVIVFSKSAQMIYDPRLHSRFSGDESLDLDIVAPRSERIRLEKLRELPSSTKL
jgi:hypothetical protein